jgi:hypothetical protein
MHWETFDRLEWKDFKANREKLRILSAQTSARPMGKETCG